MRILTRYILREVVSHALLGGALFTFVLFMRDLGRILELAVRGSASLQAVALIFLYTLPSTLILTIPMAVLVGILLGLSRLSADSEVTAMRASGFGVLQFVRVVLIASLAALGLGLINSLYVAPRTAAALLHLEGELRETQASFEIQPRVFYEDFKNYVLYVQDVRPTEGASVWRNVFLADLSEPATPHITTAQQALVLAGTRGTLLLHLHDGAQHEISAKNENQYQISTFSETDMPIQTGAQEDLRLGRSDTPLLAMPLGELWRRRGEAQGRQFTIEMHKRFSYPVACVVLMLVGVPLGLSSRRGKSTGFVLTVALVFVYYFLSSTGVALARQGKLSAFLGVWTANILFTAAGALLLRQMARGDVSPRGEAVMRAISAAVLAVEQRFRSAHPQHSANQTHRSMRTNRFPLK